MEQATEPNVQIVQEVSKLRPFTKDGETTFFGVRKQTIILPPMPIKVVPPSDED